nr:MAG TPA_asm: hypothetical protein [Caudoviricetes sp.]
MSKVVLISVRPKWCENIASGEKTIEVRKTRPNLKTPFKCYIYCTRGNDANRLRGAQGKIIGEFTCDAITRVNICGFWNDSGKQLDNRLKETCLTSEELCNYLGEKAGYGWHISNLKIYDTPRELSEFRKACPNSWYCESCAMYWGNNGTCGNESLQIKSAPQNWCYVEEK